MQKMGEKVKKLDSQLKKSVIKQKLSLNREDELEISK
jgi:hypothetical protein